ncbi:MAG: DUF4412 domain-containing protein [Candidatus Margulisbacteria bacterium]|jgi:hypothetical protein|nr:DUF4412 domain-containing protein [Candidatus Margulisiibacteriota bacterium]
MNKNKLGLGLALLLVMAASATALEFSADVETRAKGETVRSKMNVAGDKWRTETTAGGKKTVSIVRGDKKVVWMIMPDQKLYLEQKLTADHQRGMRAKQAGEVERKKIGREKINGIDTDKYEVTFKNGRKTEKMHQWISGDQWPVKSAAVDGSWSTEFKNFKKASQPEVLFIVPAGFNKMNLPTMRVPQGMNPSSLYKNMKELPDQE